MAKHAPETLAAICDRLVAHPYLKPAARSVGVNPSTVFAWLARSRSDPSSLSFAWSEVVAPFHQHVAAAMRMSVLLIESRARELALNGFEEVVTFQGQVQYEIDPRYVGVDDATMVALGLDKPSVNYNRYKRDSDGKAIPLKVKRKPSDALVTTVLRAHFRKLYGEHTSVSVGGGVWVLGGRQQPAAANSVEHKETDYVDMAPIEASDKEEARRGGYMVVGPRAQTSEEIEERERKRLASNHVVEFRDADGDDEGSVRVETSDVAPSSDVAGVAGPTAEQCKPVMPLATSRPPRDREVGYGKPAPGGYRVV